MDCKIENIDCVKFLQSYSDREFDLTFLDPPFNQDKKYRNHNDSMSEDEYWDWMKLVCKLTLEKSSQGAAIYFMQREKNTANVMKTLESTGWTFQNLIIWKKKSSAVPMEYRYGKQYQIIAYYTKGEKPRIFNRLRNDPPLLVTEKYTRPNGLYITDIWDDIREMTSGYFAGNEPLRDKNGKRFHKQQSPVHLLLRIILSSTVVGDLVFDPFAGTGTTLITAKQLNRASLGLEIDKVNVNCVNKRLKLMRDSDKINQYRHYYRYSKDLELIWPKKFYSMDTIQTLKQKSFLE